jgi:hypothetical protein
MNKVANSVKHVRSMMDLRSTPKDKGLVLRVEVKLMDNGLFVVNGTPMAGTASSTLVGAATVIRYFSQMMEEALQKYEQRIAKAA